MKRMNRRFLQLAAVAAVVVSLFTAAWAGGPPAITISGGGTAVFLDENPCNAEFSNFAVGAKIDDEGNVTGQFICMIKDCFGDQLAVIGRFTDVLSASDAGQDTVVLAGRAVLELQGFGIVDEFDFVVELREGVPLVGGFTYTDPVTGPEGDAELVTMGHIQINFH